MRASTNRQPKGTTIGGQFASRLNPEPELGLVAPIERETTGTACPKCQAPIFDDDYAGTGLVRSNVRNTYGCSGCGNQVHLAVDVDLPTRPLPDGHLDRQTMVKRISDEFSFPGFDTRHLEPNAAGVDLVNRSSFELHDERSTSDGDNVAWQGQANVGGVVLDVRNDGDGGANVYTCQSQHARVDDAVAMVKSGFPGLVEIDGAGALDVYLSLLQVSKDQR